MKNRWIDDFYSYGPLGMEYVLFEYDGIPITFVCLDTKMKRYICHCTNPIDENSWLVFPVDEKELMEFILEEKSLIDLLRKKNEVVLALKYGMTFEYKVYQGVKIPKDELPADDYTFRNDCEEYLKRITARNVIVPQKIQNGLIVPLRYRINEGGDSRPVRTKYSKIKRFKTKRNKRVLMG
ncbi:hypothetical protein SAMN05216349_15114 [Oribacterium sp. KHPX15]|uniref:hypothetical protein n=1 Tax=Oribacterium sp. KHPX15 TaxID=1855342 RepID=UPI0008967B5E|nr:hypothetical protein [Oribacterium sp. KHPX15]SEA91186.1 hypothetical protein SAMN05216349_15114 [Oribacterium sp. KHPX15]